VEHRPQRDHRKGLLETRFPRMDGGSIAAKYLASLLWGQAYYAASRNVTLSADYRF